VAAVKLGAAVRWWPRSERGQHVRHRCSDRAVDGWAPAISDFFSNLSKTGSNLKIKMGTLT
jgi:hypothetical protein